MLRIARAARLIGFALLVVTAARTEAEDAVRVFAAASLTNALNDIGKQWADAGHRTPSLAYGASSALARQIAAGAPADVFASADQMWMEHVAQRGKVATGSRINMLGNTLVLIAPKGRAFSVKMDTGFDIAGAFTGKLCTGEPGVVPVGIYARQSLDALGWWQALQGRIVGTDDVRTALAFVERGECPAGIVYATDAAISDKVDVLATFPSASHSPIVYPFALIAGARPEAVAFLTFLRTSPAVAATFRRHGFAVLAQP